MYHILFALAQLTMNYVSDNVIFLVIVQYKFTNFEVQAKTNENMTILIVLEQEHCTQYKEIKNKELDKVHKLIKLKTLEIYINILIVNFNNKYIQ